VLRRLLLVLAVPAALGAQDIVCDKGDTEVLRLEFTGNHAFPSAVLANGIATTPSNWARRTLKFFGTRYCLDKVEFPRDVIRLLLFYRNHGYYDVAVDTVVTRLGASQVAIRFAIREGQPTRISSLAITGLDSVPVREEMQRGLPLRPGGAFDRVALSAARDTLARRLRNAGYPDADVLVNYETNARARAAAVTLAALPGTRARIGTLRVNVRPYRAGKGVDTAIVRRLTGLSTGAWYRERDLERAKSTLYAGQLFTQVTVEPDTAGIRADATLPVTIGVAEGPPQSARVGGGWGTLDCFRAYGDYSHLNVARRATRVDLRARVSKIGVGQGFGGMSSLCSADAKRDYFSQELNYSTGITITPPVSARIGIQPSFTLYSERRSEYNAFLRSTPIGGSLALARAGGRRSQNASYTIEYGRTQSFPALFCAVFSACTAADQASLERLKRLAVVGLAFVDENTDNSTDPSQGTVLRGELRHASQAVGSDARSQFSRFTLDGAAYLRVSADFVMAARLRVGTVLGPWLQASAADVPPQERLYAGGVNTVRGFRQNELGPAVYIPTAYDTVLANGTGRGDPSNPSDTVYFRANPAKVGQRAVPTGGNALLVANLEGRVRSPVLPELLQLAFFADAGRVWNYGTATSLNLKSVQWTPGVGARIRTFIGLIRIDIGYNPYQRSSGAAYFDAPVSVGGQLFCVSPGNTLRVTSVRGVGAAAPTLSQQAGSCPSSFTPPREKNFLRRLAPNFSIGQAF
jgi:outer membrane protein insertion porin family/translocation and assembly module TamA